MQNFQYVLMIILLAVATSFFVRCGDESIKGQVNNSGVTESSLENNESAITGEGGQIISSADSADLNNSDEYELTDEEFNDGGIFACSNDDDCRLYITCCYCIAASVNAAEIINNIPCPMLCFHVVCRKGYLDAVCIEGKCKGI